MCEIVFGLRIRSAACAARPLLLSFADLSHWTPNGTQSHDGSHKVQIETWWRTTCATTKTNLDTSDRLIETGLMRTHGYG
jgi:hypothetical protein